MRRIRLIVQYALGISKVEANGLIILLPLVLLIIPLPAVVKKFTYSEISFKKEARQLERIIARLDSLQSTNHTVPVYHYKPFDPNNVTFESLRSMGIKRSVAQNWQKYLAYGGSFQSAEDIHKIYGLSDSVFRIIAPYVKIKEPAVQVAKNKKHMDRQSWEAQKKKEETLIKKAPPLQPFDLNLADTVTLMKIRGIGPVFSNRIVKFRQSLGGFIHKDQLREVYGLKDSLLQHLDSLVFISPDVVIRYLKINDISQKELARHPYLSQREARAIISYRYQHGSFQSIEDLHNIHLLDSLTIAKISPYLQF